MLSFHLQERRQEVDRAHVKNESKGDLHTSPLPSSPSLSLGNSKSLSKNLSVQPKVKGRETPPPSVRWTVAPGNISLIDSAFTLDGICCRKHTAQILMLHMSINRKKKFVVGRLYGYCWHSLGKIEV